MTIYGRHSKGGNGYQMNDTKEFKRCRVTGELVEVKDCVDVCSICENAWRDEDYKHNDKKQKGNGNNGSDRRDKKRPEIRA